MRLLAALVIWWFAVDAAATYGGVWDAQANPARGATVVLANGEQIQGALSRNWSKDWTIVTADGTQYTFFKYSRISYPPMRDVDASSHWRQWLPLAAINLVLVAFLIVDTRRRWRRWTH